MSTPDIFARASVGVQQDAVLWHTGGHGHSNRNH